MVRHGFFIKARPEDRRELMREVLSSVRVRDKSVVAVEPKQ
jgi:hypothetical protein